MRLSKETVGNIDQKSDVPKKLSVESLVPKSQKIEVKGDKKPLLYTKADFLDN
jgi:hypothetical protein